MLLAWRWLCIIAWHQSWWVSLKAHLTRLDLSPETKSLENQSRGSGLQFFLFVWFLVVVAFLSQDSISAKARQLKRAQRCWDVRGTVLSVVVPRAGVDKAPHLPPRAAGCLTAAAAGRLFIAT